MILHRFLQRRLQVEEPIINRSRVLAVERNHLSTGLAARDHFERLDFDASRDGVGNSRGWLTREAEFGSGARSEEHTSELQSLMRISYAVFCLQKKKHD